MIRVNEKNVIFVHKIFNAMADCILKVFLPLIIFKATGQILNAFIFLSIYYVLVCVSDFIFKKLLIKYSLICVILHIIPTIAIQFVATLCNLNSIYIVVLLAVLTCLSSSLYSIPINFIFLQYDKNANATKMEIGTNVGKFAFIICSGFIIDSGLESSIIALVIVGTVIYILSVIPLIFNYKEIKNVVKDKSNITFKDDSSYKDFYIWHIFYGAVQCFLDDLVPIYLFSKSIQYSTITMVAGGVEIIKIGCNILGGRLLKMKHPKIILSIMMILNTICLSTMLLIDNKIFIIILYCICTSLHPLMFIPLFKIYCERIKRDKNVSLSLAYRDTLIYSLRPVLPMLLIIFESFVPMIFLSVLYLLFMEKGANNIVDNYKKDG
jgi:hypothetical protein